MKNFLAVFCLLLSAATLQAKDKPNSADFNIKIHISASRILNYCEAGAVGPTICGYGLSADATVDGRKFMIWGASNIDQYSFVVLVPGDYKARLTSDIHNSSNTVIHQEYDVVLSDSTIWHCRVIGLSE